jgi:hypothetical protein
MSWDLRLQKMAEAIDLAHRAIREGDSAAHRAVTLVFSRPGSLIMKLSTWSVTYQIFVIVLCEIRTLDSRTPH